MIRVDDQEDRRDDTGQHHLPRPSHRVTFAESSTYQPKAIRLIWWTVGLAVSGGCWATFGWVIYEVDRWLS